MARKKRGRWKAAEKRTRESLPRASALGGPTHVETTEDAAFVARLRDGSVSDLFPKPGQGSDSDRYTGIMPVRNSDVGATEALRLSAIDAQQQREQATDTGSTSQTAAALAALGDRASRVLGGRELDPIRVANESRLADMDPDEVRVFVGEERAAEFMRQQEAIRSATNNEDRMLAKARGLDIVLDAYEMATAARDASAARKQELADQIRKLEGVIVTRGRATELDALIALGDR